MKKLLILIGLFCLALVSQGNDLQECQTALDSFKTKLNSYSHYIPVDNVEDMGMETRKRADNVPDNCFNLNSTDPLLVKINCQSHLCMGILYDLVKEYDGLFSETCSPAEGFTVDTITQGVMETLRDMKECNRCVVLYTQFTKLQVEMEAAECWPTETEYSCEGECLPMINRYIMLYNEMLRQQKCRMNNPGGCGMSGGMTEGQIYDKLVAMTEPMNRVYTVDSICHFGCEDDVKNWHNQWKSLAANECLQSANGVDLAQDDLTMRVVTLEPQCDEQCQTQISDLINEFNKIPQDCQKLGLQADHKNALVNAINMKNCEGEEDESSWDIFGQMTVAKGFFTLSILGVGCVLVYLIGGVMYRRCVKGKKGWDACPSFNLRKKSKPTTSSRRTHNRRDDGEEEVILFEASDDEDHL